MHVPDGFLLQIFGPRVAEAKALYREAAQDKELLGALLLSGATNRMITRFKVQGSEAVGWDDEGTEVARVPFTEPIYIRDHHDRRFDVYRHNTT